MAKLPTILMPAAATLAAVAMVAVDAPRMAGTPASPSPVAASATAPTTIPAIFRAFAIKTPLAIKPITVLDWPFRSEEHTSELQSLMRISYAVFCLKKKKKHNTQIHTQKYSLKVTYNNKITRINIKYNL